MFDEVTEKARRWQDYIKCLPIFFTFEMTVGQQITGFTYYVFFGHYYKNTRLWADMTLGGWGEGNKKCA